MYLMLGTRPDIAYAVGRFARFAHDPSKDHFKAVGRLFSYVNATKHFGIMYTKTMDETYSILPSGSCDADFAGELAKGHRRKSTSGYIFHMAGAPFSWSSKLQKTIAHSTMEAELIALDATARQAAWTRNIFEAIGLPFEDALDIYCDNEATIQVAKGEGSHEAKKHIDKDYFYVLELVEKNLVEMNYVESKSNEADILTKRLTGQTFARGLELIGFSGSEDYISSLRTSPVSSSSSNTPNPDISSISVYVDAQD